MVKKAAKLLLSLSLSLNLSAQIQVIDSFQYSGSPNDLREKVISTTPGTQLKFIFCTLNVPDHLNVDLCGQGFHIYVGEKYIDPSCDHGFRHYKFDGAGFQLINYQNWTPPDVVRDNPECEYQRGAAMVDITVPEGCCQLKWTVVGNNTFPTIYTLKVYETLKGSIPIVDTVETYSCTKAYKQVESIGCEKFLYLYADSSIKENPIITQPKCLEPGSIVFPNFPEKSLYNLFDGDYEVTLSNQVCEKTFNFTLEDRHICNYYFPNAIKPQSSENNKFQLFFDKPLEYDLFIYDRWGNQLYHKRLVSDTNEGWDGTYRNFFCTPGVYIWRAVVYSDQTYYPSGDVTLIE
jgi:hypothetical protein